MRLVPIECVKTGTFLAKTLYDDDGRILLSEGVELSDIYIERIRDKKIFSVYIIDEYSEKEIEDIIKPDLRQKAIKQLKDTFSSIESLIPNEPALKEHSHVTDSISKGKGSLYQNISSIAETLMEELLNRKNILINLVDIKSMDNYTYQHSVNVAVLSLIIGIQLQLNKFELYELCIGSLVHDIGKVFIPKEILFKEGKLSESEFEIIRQHPEKGYNYLKKMSDISAIARIIILQHHERFDGRGYPERKKGNEIHKLSRIVALADVYDALTSDRSYRRAISPNEALEYIMASGNSHFDYDIVKAFARVIVPYPEGCLVSLSNGAFGVVEEVCQSYPLRPKIKIIKSEAPSTVGSCIDLIEELGIVINGIEYEIS